MMSAVADDFRCSRSSLLDEEPMAGTAPTDRAWLFVEHAAAWGRDAPTLVAEHVAVPANVRVQLIRRHGRHSSDRLTVFAAWADGERFRVESTTLAGLSALGGLDLTALGEGRSPGLTPYDDALWLVCTHGRRDLCCATTGRPVAAALAERWPEQTWETTHLGGHRFAGTLLALPSGLCLGRLDAETAVAACQDLAHETVPLTVSRGRAGLPGPAQAAELALRARLDATSLGDLAVHAVDQDLDRVLDADLGHDPDDDREPDHDTVTIRAGAATWRAVVHTAWWEPRRQSCADLKTTPAARYDVLSLTRHG